MSGCKRGDQEKPRRTPSGREKGHWFLNVNLVNVTDGFLQRFSDVTS
jgi:hypothetical protein